MAFFTLPTELREEIYRYVFAPGIEYRGKAQSAKTRFNLLLVCRRLRAEATQVLANDIFVIFSTLEKFDALLDIVKKERSMIPSSLRKLEVHLDYDYWFSALPHLGMVESNRFTVMKYALYVITIRGGLKVLRPRCMILRFTADPFPQDCTHGSEFFERHRERLRTLFRRSGYDDPDGCLVLEITDGKTSLKGSLVTGPKDALTTASPE